MEYNMYGVSLTIWWWDWRWDWKDRLSVHHLLLFNLI